MACKPGSVPPGPEDPGAAIIPLDRPSRDGSRDLPGPLDRRRPCRIAPAHGPYSVLLLAGLAMPCLLPGTRCALTAPFHPSRPGGRRFAFCGAIPGVAPGGRYPPPCRRGARTFLERLAAPATARPSGPRGKWSLAAPGSTRPIFGGQAQLAHGDGARRRPVDISREAAAGRSAARGSRRRRSRQPAPGASAVGTP